MVRSIIRQAGYGLVAGPRGKAMYYHSTRGQDGPLGYEDALLSGLARDGGLYLPVKWPTFSPDEIAGMRDLSYAQLASRVMAPFCDGEIDESELEEMAGAAYAEFDHPAIAPLVQLDDTIHVLELFHGPTIAFKDYAMQFCQFSNKKNEQAECYAT